MASIRIKLVAGLVAAILAVAVVAGGVLLLVVRGRVIGDFDLALGAKARAMAAMVHRDARGRVEVDFAEEMMGEFTARKRPEYFTVRDAAGHTIERSPSLAGGDLPPAAKDPRPVTLPNGRPGRAVAITFVPEPADEDDEKPGAPRPLVTLTLARSTHSIEEMLEVVALGLAVAAGVMAAGAALAVWFLVDRGLRPLRALADRASAIDAATLTNRFDSAVPSELRPIVERLNELLARLESAFARERRFTAAAAHELRTPIAELRAMAELATRWPGDPANPGMPDVLAVARNMESLAASLLALSRCESGQERPRRQPVDLAAAVTRAWEPQVVRASRRNLTFRLDRADGDTTVLADPTMTDAVLRNLLENAAEYAPAGTQITCRLVPGTLTLLNAQEGLTATDVSHLFEPFWRKDKARSGGTHAGLGLSLVKAYAAAMSATVHATLTPERDFRIDLTFPAVPHPTSPAEMPVIQPSSFAPRLPTELKS